MRLSLDPAELTAVLRAQVRQVTAVRVTNARQLEIDVTLHVGPIGVDGTATIAAFEVERGRLIADAVVHTGRMRAPGMAVRVALAKLWHPRRSSLPRGLVDMHVDGSRLRVEIDLGVVADIVERAAGVRLTVHRVEIGPELVVVGTLAN
ncbi:hypothetical protein [Demequina sp.]|uniref:hypothetical protein n=1 Tax=Demequina sp. TaxID=2050685 RepID=UPI003A876069